jgi:hypothetical protein
MFNEINPRDDQPPHQSMIAQHFSAHIAVPIFGSRDHEKI